MFQLFTELEGWLPWLQDPSTGLYAELNGSAQYGHILFLRDASTFHLPPSTFHARTHIPGTKQQAILYKSYLPHNRCCNTGSAEMPSCWVRGPASTWKYAPFLTVITQSDFKNKQELVSTFISLFPKASSLKTLHESLGHVNYIVSVYSMFTVYSPIKHKCYYIYVTSRVCDSCLIADILLTRSRRASSNVAAVRGTKSHPVRNRGTADAAHYTHTIRGSCCHTRYTRQSPRALSVCLSVKSESSFARISCSTFLVLRTRRRDDIIV
jgi:hypothetical protein